MDIVVLCGGTSTERDISLMTSQKVAAALKKCGHRCILIDVFFGSEKMPDFSDEQDFKEVADEYRALTCLLNDELKNGREFFGPYVLDICRKADIVFLGLHGADGEDGKVQAVFDLLRIRYTGSGYLGSAIAMSKERTKVMLHERIKMPAGLIVKRNRIPKEHFPVPCVIKPSNGGSSVGVYIIEDDADYEAALYDALKYDDTVLIEEYIDGRELTQGVLDGRALPPVEIKPGEGFYDYTNKYNGRTEEICPADISGDVLEEMSAYSLKAGDLLGLSVYYRADYKLSSAGVLYLLEVNTLPGMTDTSLVPREAAAIGMSYEELCEKIIEASLQKH